MAPQIVAAYGDLQLSVLQDFERGRPTEVDFIHGHVVSQGHRFGTSTPANAAVMETVRAIMRGGRRPDTAHLPRLVGDQPLQFCGEAPTLP